MTRFVIYALPLLMLLMASFGFIVDLLELEPRAGSVIRLAFFEQPRVPAQVVLGAWAMESCGLLALFLLAQGRCGSWWLDGLVAGWLGWVFRGPLLVVTLVVAARQPQDPWWQIAFGWWILYSVCGLALGFLFHRSLRAPAAEPEDEHASEAFAERAPEEAAVAVAETTTEEDSGTEADSDTSESSEPKPAAAAETEDASSVSIGIIDGPVDSSHPEAVRAIEEDAVPSAAEIPAVETPAVEAPAVEASEPQGSEDGLGEADPSDDGAEEGSGSRASDP